MIIRLTKGDNYPPTNLTITRDGIPYDCTGGTAYIYLKNVENGHIYSERCDINATVVTFSFSPYSTSEVGVYLCNIIITLLDGTAFSIPNKTYINVIIKESVSPFGGVGILYDQNYMKISTYDKNQDGVVDCAKVLEYGTNGKSYTDIHNELVTHAGIQTVHHSNINDPNALQKGALDASFNPSATNRYITFSDMNSFYFIDDITFEHKGEITTDLDILPTLIVKEQIISSLKGYIRVLPVDQSIVFDIRKNNPLLLTNSIFVSTPNIPVNLIKTNGVYQFDFTTLLDPNKMLCEINDVLYFVILQVGNSTKGNDICIKMILS